MTGSDVLIIGAGITGTATAWFLAEAGVSVTVIDQYGPAAMATGWSLAGVRQSGRDPAELPLAQAAVALWPDLDKRLDGDTGYRQNGNLRLARTPDEIETIKSLVARQRDAGLDLLFLDDIEAIRAIAPALSDRVLAAAFCPTDGHADPNASVAAFKTAAERKGARFLGGTEVLSIETKGGRFAGARTSSGLIEAETCLLATGLKVNDLLGPLGHEIPLRLPMVTVVQTVPLPPTLLPVLGVANADLAGRQQVDGRLRVTSGASDLRSDVVVTDGVPRVAPPAQSVKETIEKVSDVLPALATAPVARIWAGLLDLTPDALPVMDRVPGIGQLFVAAGFSGHGFGIGPATGMALANLVSGRDAELSLDAFAFGRFDGKVAYAPLTLHG